VPDATDLQTLCDQVLDASIMALDTIPGFAPGFEGAPARTFTGAGQPVFDCCPQLSVNAGVIREAPTEPLGLGSGTRHRLAFRKSLVGVQVWIARCSANGEAGQPPTTEALVAVSEQVNADGWALWNTLWNVNRGGSSDPIVSLCDEWYMDALTPLQPSGGCSGWLLSIRAELSGYGDGSDP
jgi:hypothetical protein